MSRRSRRHGWRSPVETEEVRQKDEDGRYVTRHRVVDTLGRMLRAGTITGPMADAGRKLQREFALAQLDPRRAPSLTRIPGNGNAPDPGESTQAARDTIHAIMQRLGGHDAPMGSVVWHVLGCGASVREWAMRQGWGGRCVRPEQAQGILIAALDVLAGYYDRPQPGPPGAPADHPEPAARQEM